MQYESFVNTKCCVTLALPVWWTAAPVAWSWAFRSLSPTQKSALFLADSQCRSSVSDSASSPSCTPPPPCSTCVSADRSKEKNKDSQHPWPMTVPWYTVLVSVTVVLMWRNLELQVSAPHHGHVLLLAQRGVPHGQFVVFILHSQQLVAVGVSLLPQLVVPWTTDPKCKWWKL